MKLCKKILITLGLVITGQCNAINLIGIYNNLSDKYRVSVQGSYTDVKGKPFSPEDSDYQAFQIAANKPVKVIVSYQDAQYPIVIKIAEEGQSCSQGYRIEAYVDGFPSVPKQTTCVSNATTRFLPGKQFDAFQGVILALSPDPKNSPLPFKFGLSAWTSTKEPWDQQKISNPADTSAITFSKPLLVVQGYPAWGGGLTPLFNHGNITHIYNDTPYTLYFERNVAGSNANIERLVPPYAAVPWASVWVPNDPTDTKKPEIRMFIMQPPVNDSDLPPSGFEKISSVGDFELGPTVTNIQDTIAEMQANVPSAVATMIGQPDLSPLMQRNTFFIGKYCYKFSTDEATKKINIKKCNIINASETGGQEFIIQDCSEYKKPMPATTASGQPLYYKLVVKTTNLQGDLNLELSQIPDEKVH